MAGPPREEFLRIFQPHGAVDRILGAVGKLVRIHREIEQERLQTGEMNVFEALVADHGERAGIEAEPERLLCRALLDIAEIELPVDRVAPRRRRPSIEERGKRTPVEMAGRDACGERY